MFDVFLLSLEQKFAVRKRILEPPITVKAMNWRGKKRPKYYNEYFPTINHLSGIQYKLFGSTEMGEFECGDDIFKIGFEDSIPVYEVGYPEYFFGDNNKSEHYPLSLSEEYHVSFCAVMDKLLKKSPIQTLAFLCFGGNSNGREIVIGTVPMSKFIELFAQKKIYTNICYFITKDEDEVIYEQRE